MCGDYPPIIPMLNKKHNVGKERPLKQNSVRLHEETLNTRRRVERRQLAILNAFLITSGWFVFAFLMFLLSRRLGVGIW